VIEIKKAMNPRKYEARGDTQMLSGTEQTKIDGQDYASGGEPRLPLGGEGLLRGRKRGIFEGSILALLSNTRRGSFGSEDSGRESR